MTFGYFRRKFWPFVRLSTHLSEVQILNWENDILAKGVSDLIRENRELRERLLKGSK